VVLGITSTGTPGSVSLHRSATAVDIATIREQRLYFQRESRFRAKGKYTLRTPTIGTGTSNETSAAIVSALLSLQTRTDEG
jgi:hypothetical protein